MKRIIYILFFLLLYAIKAETQELRIPIEKKGGHLFSQWIFNDSIKANVLLESGYPKAIFSQSFIEQNHAALNVKLQKPSKDIYVSFWSGNQKYKALYTINDSISINGAKLYIDGLVVNTDEIASWKNRDVLFPISDLQKRVALNIDSGYMRMLSDTEEIPDDYISFNVSKDEFTKALYLATTLIVYDANGNSEKVYGNFQLDLGAGNAFMLNKNQPNVAEFFTAADRMILKDTTQIQGPKNLDISIAMPSKIRFANIEVEEGIIVGLKYRGERSKLYTGSIGPSFFQKFIAIFDFENSKFYLKPKSDKIRAIE